MGRSIFFQKIQACFLALLPPSSWSKYLIGLTAWATMTYGGGVTSFKSEFLMIILACVFFLLATITLQFVVPAYLVCQKINSLLPSLPKKELWWPVFWGNFCTTVQLPLFGWMLKSVTKGTLANTLSPDAILLLFGMIFFKIFYIDYKIIRCTLSTQFIKNKFESRGISFDQFEKSIWSANIYSIKSMFLIYFFITFFSIFLLLFYNFK
jgi:hypothetical protein